MKSLPPQTLFDELGITISHSAYLMRYDCHNLLVLPIVASKLINPATTRHLFRRIKVIDAYDTSFLLNQIEHVETTTVPHPNGHLHNRSPPLHPRSWPPLCPPKLTAWRRHCSLGALLTSRNENQ